MNNYKSNKSINLIENKRVHLLKNLSGGEKDKIYIQKGHSGYNVEVWVGEVVDWE